MFVPHTPNKDKFRDLYARVVLKTEIPSLPPEICTQKSYHRWQIASFVFLVLLVLLYYLLKS
jgi:hypothetical protein